MNVPLKQLLNKIPATQILCDKRDPHRYFEGLCLLSENIQLTDAPVIYIGSASYLPEHLENLHTCCLIIRNNTDRDFSQLKCDHILLNASAKIVEIYEEMETIWSALENRMCIAFYDKLARTGNLENILGEIAKELSCAVLIMDSKLDGKLITYAGCVPFDDQSFSQLIKTGHSTESHAVAARQEGVVREIADSTIPILVGPGKYKTRRRILGNITVHNQLAGYMIAIENEKPFTSFDIKRISTACEAMTHIAEEDIGCVRDMNLTSVFIRSHLKALMEGMKHDTALVSNWMLHSNGKSSFFWVFVLDADSGSASGRIIFDYLQKQCQQYHAQIFEYNQHYTIVLNAYSAETYENFMTQLAELLNQHQCHGAASLRFHNYDELNKYYQQAVDALKLGKQMDTGNWLISYHDIKVHLLLSEIPIEILLEKYYDNSLSALKSYDQKKGTAYYETLHMYLKCACSRSATANRLYVHRNTVAYQLNKIQEILDIDLDDGEACLQLYLSYKICELRNPCNNG